MPDADHGSGEDRVDVVLAPPAAPADRDTDFAAFVRRSSPELGRLAWLLCGDAVRAEDLLQSALLRTYLAWSRAGAGDPVAYTRRVLVNARIDDWRHLRRERLTAPEDLPVASVASGADVQAERDRLVRALATLTARQRRVVVLRHLVGLPEAEVAADLGVSLGTVKSTASRGLAQLRAVLTDDDGGAPGGAAHDDGARPDGAGPARGRGRR